MSRPLVDEPEAVASDLELLNAKLISPQHVCSRHNLDFDEEQDLIEEAENSGWELTQDGEMGNMGENQANGTESESSQNANSEGG